MKSEKNIFDKMVDPDNLVLASQKAMKGKSAREIDLFKENMNSNLMQLHELIKSQQYKPSGYREMKIYDPKERIIKIAPFFPDRIVHHVLMNVLEPIFTKVYIHNSYACVKGKGGHQCTREMYSDMNDHYTDTQYCLKLDVRKFYDHIDHDILKAIIRRKIADNKALWLIDLVIDSTSSGIPIGNYTSQHFANLYLSYFDHYCKEDLRLKHYYRYMDDIVILASSKPELQHVLNNVKIYLEQRLKLELKGNWQIFPVNSRQIDFCGYRVNHHGIMLRKKILYNYFRKLRKHKSTGEISSETQLKRQFPSHYGWIKHTSTPHFNHILKTSINGKIEN